jgi:electron transport complex protein RnfD
MTDDLSGPVPPAPVVAPPASSPHAHDRSSVSRLMLHVGLALVPVTLFGFHLFGWPAFNLFLVTIAAALATEALCLRAGGASWRRLLDGSALLTGWLLALSLPPWAPWWIGAGGAVFALAVGKHLYGGIGQNLFNPAMLARVALLVSFPLQMTTWVVPQAHLPDFLQGLAITFGGATPADGSTGATALGGLRTAFTLHQDARTVLAAGSGPAAAAVGVTGGSLGETSELLVLLGGAWLLGLRIISWEIPLAMLLAVAVPAAFASLVHPERHPGALFHMTSGGLLLGAFFIATDPVTSPASRLGRLLFGAGCGVLTWVIRSWGSFPEAVAFAVLFMNAVTPLLDRYCRPRAYGRGAGGRPLKAMGATANVKRGDQT